MNRKIIVASVLLVVAAFMVLIVWVYFRNPYMRVVVGEMQTVTIRINSVEYMFGKEGNMLSIYPWDDSRYPNNVIYSPQEGQTYRWLGIDITVMEVHADRFVLSITAIDESE